jgi:DNA-binding MarR family transcriptional regulator
MNAKLSPPSPEQTDLEHADLERDLESSDGANPEVSALDRALSRLAATFEIVYVRRPLEGLLGDDDEVTTAQLRALNLLAAVPEDDPGLPVGALASGLRISYPAATKAVDRLAERGLADRHRDANDARQIRVRLTQKGFDVVSHVAVSRRAKLERVLHDLGDVHDRVRLLELIERFTALSLSDPGDLEEVIRESGV